MAPMAVAYSGSKPGTLQGSSAIEATQTLAVVETGSGSVAGYFKDGNYIYKGIPYARAERFMAPVEVEPWDGVRSCRHYGPTAPQATRTGYANDEIAFAFDWDDGYTGEDCQRLNIWTPGINEDKKRPVMVWLHGGGIRPAADRSSPRTTVPIWQRKVMWW